jgi:hypothetical protein
MEPSTKKICVYLFLTLNFLFLVTSSGRVRTIDEVSVDLQTESLAMHGNTAVPQAEAMGTFYGKRDRWGLARAPYGTGQAAVTVPWHYAGRILRAVLSKVPEKSKDVFLDAVVTASSATFAASDRLEPFCTSPLTEVKQPASQFPCETQQPLTFPKTVPSFPSAQEGVSGFCHSR